MRFPSRRWRFGLLAALPRVGAVVLGCALALASSSKVTEANFEKLQVGRTRDKHLQRVAQTLKRRGNHWTDIDPGIAYPPPGRARDIDPGIVSQPKGQAHAMDPGIVLSDHLRARRGSRGGALR